MSVFSKPHTEYTCKDVHCWTNSCVGATLDLAGHSLKGGCLLFFGPIYLIQLMLKYRKISREYLRQHFQAYIQSCAFGTMMSGCFLASHCILRKVLRRYYLSTMAFVPGFISGLTILTEHHSRRGIVITTYINMTLEYIMRHLEQRGLIDRTRRKETFVFMIFSGVLMFLLRKYHRNASKAAQLWFFVPLPPRYSQKDADRKKLKTKKSQNDINHNNSYCLSSISPRICPHSGSCWRHILKVSWKMFIIGVGLQVVRYFTPHTRKGNSSSLCNWNTFLLSGFLGGYVGIFQVVSCLMNQYRSCDSEMHCMLAGFLAGSTYWLYPNITIAFSAFTTILQVLALEISQNGFIPHPGVVAAIIFAICNATLFHGKLVEPKLCPRLLSTLISIGCHGKIDIMHKEAQKIIVELSSITQ